MRGPNAANGECVQGPGGKHADRLGMVRLQVTIWNLP